MTTFKHRKVQKKRKYGLYALLVGLIAAAILALSVFFAVSYTKDRSDGNRDADTAGSVRLGKK